MTIPGDKHLSDRKKSVQWLFIVSYIVFLEAWPGPAGLNEHGAGGEHYENDRWRSFS